MKKTIIALLAFATCTGSFAQLKVKSSGNVVAGSELTGSGWSAAFQTGTALSSSNNNAAIYGHISNTGSSVISYGVYGLASSTSQYTQNYGVVGALGTNTHGIGVLGCTYPISGTSYLGTFAGMFIGDTHVNGTLSATSIVQTSDLRLKENIVPFNKHGESILDKVLDMNVVEFNYKKMLPFMKFPDSVSVDEIMKAANINPEKKHIGLIAQELQELFPTLVEEGQDGFLGVNYVELVPVLIRAIQELKGELDAVKGSDGSVRKAPATTSVNTALTGANVLYQNTPNPFKEQTTIRFSLADDAQSASICIFDMTGKMLKNLPVSSGDTSVSIAGWELGEGMFLYTLIVNGKEIDTKRMIITK